MRTGIGRGNNPNSKANMRNKRRLSDQELDRMLTEAILAVSVCKARLKAAVKHKEKLWQRRHMRNLRDYWHGKVKP